MNADKVKEHAAYIAALRAAGEPILGFNTPCCTRSMESHVPRSCDETWDTLCTCPYCDQLFVKIATKFKVEGRIPR